MGKYSKEKNYDKQIAYNTQRMEFECPCCRKIFLVTEAQLEKFELFREMTLYPSPGYLVHYAGYRICKKCYHRRDWGVTIPLKFLKYTVIIAVASTIVAFAIDADKYGLVTLGLWLAIGTPLFLLAFLIPNTVFHKYTKRIDFDKALNDNAVDWYPNFEDEK